MDPGHSEYHPGTVSPEDVIAEARRWLGTPYRHQGRGPDAFDCVGFIIRIATDLALFDGNAPRNYSRLPQNLLLDEVARHCREVPENGPGLMVLIQWAGTKQPAHAAISTGENLIHCYRTSGKVVEHGFRAPWDKLAHSFWRLPRVTY